MADYVTYQRTSGFAALLLLVGCQGSQVYTPANIGPAPFLVNVAPVAYSRIEPTSPVQPSGTVVESQPIIYASPEPQAVYSAEPERVRMAEPVVETVVYSDPVPQTLIYDDVAVMADPVYAIESETIPQDSNIYIEEAAPLVEQPVQTFVDAAPAFPPPPSGIEVEFIAPPTVSAPALTQPGISSYGEAF